MTVIVQTAGQIEALLQPSWFPLRTGSLSMYDRYYYDYATIYRTQPNVRVCVDFLARNIAQLGLHTFRRVSETDRKRLRDHPLALLIQRPLPNDCKLTRYRLIERTISDLCVYFDAFWLKVRGEDGAMGLLPLKPPMVSVKGSLIPTEYEITFSGRLKTFAPSEIVHFRGYNPDNAANGLPPLETLRRILAEEAASGENREYFWRNAARMNGVIERPAGAPGWSEQARERFRAEWGALHSGGPNSGETAILEEGMTWKPAAFSPRESEYLEGRKLTREECARSYHIPLPMVGILDNATFSNIEEQHKNLYQDCLGPWLVMLEEDIELQLLPEFEDVEGVYVEFNIAEKLAGSFTEQTVALQSAVGRPWMTANEARARQNLPSLRGDAGSLVTPLNVIIGGQASPQDSMPGAWASGAAPILKARRRLDSYEPGLIVEHRRMWTQALGRHFRRQESAILSRVPKARKTDAGGVWWDDDRWNNELQADLVKLTQNTVVAFARRIADDLDAEIDEDWMNPWIEEHARVMAESINAQTAAGITQAMTDPEPMEAVKRVFEIALSVRAAQLAWSAVTSASNFGSHEAAQAGGLKTKTWVVNSGNPRPEHAAMNGETVGIRDLFSNGMRWPGDSAGGAENNANCECSVQFGR